MVDSAVSPPVGYPAPISNDLAPTIAALGRNLQQLPTFSPTNTFEPSRGEGEYLIGEPEYETVGPTGLFEGALRVKHGLGVSVPANMAFVELFDTDCLNQKPKSGLAVYLPETGSNQGGGIDFFYDIAFNHSLITDNVGGFFNFSEGGSVGIASFCTRVLLNGTTNNGIIPMFFRESNIAAGFNLTNRDFTITDVTIEEAGIVDNNITDTGPAYFISSCLCDDDFACIDPTSAVLQNTPLVFCIEPSHPSDRDNVRITNFNLNIAAGDINYSPVWYGVDGWENNVVTIVEESGKIVRTSTLLIQDFYLEDYQTVDLSGNAFLEFDEVSSDRARDFYAFGMLVILGTPQRIGCIAKLIADVFGFF